MSQEHSSQRSTPRSSIFDFEEVNFFKNSMYNHNGYNNSHSTHNGSSQPDRSVSAPPQLELATESLFAFMPPHGGQILHQQDLRSSPNDDYYSFSNSERSYDRPLPFSVEAPTIAVPHPLSLSNGHMQHPQQTNGPQHVSQPMAHHPQHQYPNRYTPPAQNPNIHNPNAHNPNIHNQSSPAMGMMGQISNHHQQHTSPKNYQAPPTYNKTQPYPFINVPTAKRTFNGFNEFSQFSSSPSALTPISTAQFIWKDEKETPPPSPIATNALHNPAFHHAQSNSELGMPMNSAHLSQPHNNPSGPSSVLSSSGSVSQQHPVFPRSITPPVAFPRSASANNLSSEDFVHMSHPQAVAQFSAYDPNSPVMQHAKATAPSGGTSANTTANPAHNAQAQLSSSSPSPATHLKSNSMASSGESSGSSNPESEDPTDESKVVCRFFASGYCSRGDKCFYSHDMNETSSVTSSTPAPVIEKPKTPEPKTPTKGSKKSNPKRKSDNSFHSFDQVRGSIYEISKDQQGCRFLQKKLEDNDPEATQSIFVEVIDHIVELMTDPFGNYLCQKLLEHANNAQKIQIVNNVAPELVNISKNMHGTRAAQKMIECLSTPEQITAVRNALQNYVVQLIQDLNGNHVIQRCLNRLDHKDNQFIYDAVTSGNNCVQVATHRHGCCVLQRCIDHASHQQKIQLTVKITDIALTLVKDPYGNYVVQYVLDLPFPELVEMLSKSFLGHLPELSQQKFSSNVIEKCLQVSPKNIKKQLVDEILLHNNFVKMLQDPYANYVVQTALSAAEGKQYTQLVDALKPYLLELKNTPTGKRIQGKLQQQQQQQRERHHSRTNTN